VRVPGDSTPDHSSWTHGRWVPTHRRCRAEQHHLELRTRWPSERSRFPADDQPGISDQRGQPVKIRSAGQHRVSAEASGSGHSILGAQQGVVDICSLVPQTAAPQLACEASGWVVTRSPQTMAYPRGRVPTPRATSSRNARRKCHRSRRSPAERIAARPCRTAGGAPWHHCWSSLTSTSTTSSSECSGLSCHPPVECDVHVVLSQQIAASLRHGRDHVSVQHGGSCQASNGRRLQKHTPSAAHCGPGPAEERSAQRCRGLAWRLMSVGVDVASRKAKGLANP